MALVIVVCLVLGPDACGQTETATIRGSVTDPTGAVVPGTTVRLIDIDRGPQTDGATGTGGLYTFASVRPGHYRIEAEKSGFKMVRLTGITVNVQDNLEENFKLSVGAVSESITVEANNAIVNATDAAVSTLIDNRFVENMPLNGRSFSSLIDLTPGVVLAPANYYEQGQFSVNGQRPDANYYMLDGVSANLGNVGSGGNLAQSGAGQLPATTAFGGTNNLVSLDALEEFRIQTSTFAPEYGRTPGAQISVVTKSGTNAFHGTVFEYFRNDVLDANDWFANHLDLRKPELRQNDFGGVLGGPITKDKLFFFGSYEGLRVRQPLVANTYVPDLASRQNAPAVVQPLLNAFPLPTSPGLGNNTAAFAASYSDPSTLNSSGIRIDYLLSQKVTIFGRYSDAPSSIAERGSGGGTDLTAYNSVDNTKYRTRTLTLGTNQVLSPRLTNEFRFNYSRSRANNFFTLDNFGGAVPPTESQLYGSFVPPQNAYFLFFGDFNNHGLKFRSGKEGNNLQQQINLTDNLSHVIGAHQLKFGLDYRRLNPQEGAAPYSVQYIFGSLSNILANNLPEAFVVARTADVQLVFSNWSVFAQDTWNITRNLTITYGLRWEYNAAPSSPNGTLPFTVNQVENLATMTLAPAGTPLWHAQKHDFAPRLGVAWQPHPNLVLRAGAGIFYDLGYSDVADGMDAWPYGQAKLLLSTPSSPLSFPLSAANAAPPPFCDVLSPSCLVSYLAVVDPHHVLPRTYEWNAAVEQTLGSTDVLTLTYLGAGGRKLMRQDIYYQPNPAVFTGEVDLMRNGATSSYQALQAQFRHRMAHGLQTLLSYTWAHSIDDVPSDVFFLNVPPGNSSSDRGSSDYDIRHTFAGAVSYDIPGPGRGLWKSILGNWSTDSIIYARSATPVNVVTGLNPFPGTFLSGTSSVQRPNVIPGVSFYLDESGAPGGKIINAVAFTPPITSTQGDLGRNALRGFGATQLDLTLRRRFRLTETVALQARADFFNIFNHPNFGNPVNYLSNTAQFGQSTMMLASSLGSGGQSGGLSPLYQIGGPRSIQLALKLQF
jgi:Carboxypeptidase regulatory-like domain/TonB dependent receptor